MYNITMKLKVLSFNIHKGFNWSNSKLTIESIKNAIHKTEVDLVFLQEVVGENHTYSKKMNQWIDKQYEFIADGKWEDYAYGKNAVYDYRHHGNAILSKYPIINWEQIDISTNKYEQRGILFCEIQLPETVLHAYCIHLNLLHRDRKKQYLSLIKEIEKRSSQKHPILIAGDFNDWNKKASSALTDHHFMEGHKSIHGYYAKTFPSIFPILSLDRIYLRNISALKSQTLKDKSWTELSDHRPLFIEVDIK